tara:strand:- start:148 stop:426 length:279 start_codon:yes stop_codon:yes gene_type:complete
MKPAVIDPGRYRKECGAGTNSNSIPLIVPMINGPFGERNFAAIKTMQKARKKCAPDPRNSGPITIDTEYDKTKYSAVKIVANAISWLREILA